MQKTVLKILIVFTLFFGQCQPGLDDSDLRDRVQAYFGALNADGTPWISVLMEQAAEDEQAFYLLEKFIDDADTKTRKAFAELLVALAKQKFNGLNELPPELEDLAIAIACALCCLESWLDDVPGEVFNDLVAQLDATSRMIFNLLYPPRPGTIFVQSTTGGGGGPRSPRAHPAAAAAAA